MEKAVSDARFSRITLVTVTGLTDAQAAANALMLSKRNMPGAQALLCCPHAPANLADGIRHVPITPLSYIEYSWFVMFALWSLIETDYALIVQDDGWVLDAANWRDEYFDYDYIGALCNHARVTTPDGPRMMREYNWCEFLDRPDHVVMPVLNGGFSLRSRRMLSALIDHPEITVEVARPDVLGGAPFGMHWVFSGPNEDSQLTAVLRPQLEAVGIRYAPVELCQQFAIEDGGPMHMGFDTMKLFGHHARWRRLVSIDPPTVRYSSPAKAVEDSEVERAMAAMLTRRGYRVEYTEEAVQPA